MIYDLRTYDLHPGGLQTFIEAVRDVGLKVRTDHGVKLAGWYYTDVGRLNRVVHIWAYRDYAHYGEAKEAVAHDPRWINEFRPRVKGLWIKQEDMIMRAPDFFPGPG